MQVGAGGNAGGAYLSDDLTLGHPLACHGDDPAHVAVHRAGAVVMLNLHAIAQAIVPAFVGQHNGARLGGVNVGAPGSADVHTQMIGAGAGARCVAAAVAAGDQAAGGGPDEAAHSGLVVAAGLLGLADLLLELLLPGGLLVQQRLLACLAGGILLKHPGSLGHLGVQLRLAGGKLRLMLLQVRLILSQLLAQGAQLVNDALIVLHDLVDKIHAAQQVRKARGLEQHGPVGHGAPFLLLPHLAAEQVVLLLLLRLVLGDPVLGVLDLHLQQVDLLGNDGGLLVQQLLLLQGLGLVGLDLVQLLLDLLLFGPGLGQLVIETGAVGRVHRPQGQTQGGHHGHGAHQGSQLFQFGFHDGLLSFYTRRNFRMAVRLPPTPTRMPTPANTAATGAQI